MPTPLRRADGMASLRDPSVGRFARSLFAHSKPSSPTSKRPRIRQKRDGELGRVSAGRASSSRLRSPSTPGA